MDLANETDLVCRSCMTILDSHKFELFRIPQLSELYVRLSSTNMDKEDPLSKTICSSCYHRLKDFESFQKMCLESYQVLLSRLPEKVDVKEECLEVLVKEEDFVLSLYDAFPAGSSDVDSATGDNMELNNDPLNVETGEVKKLAEQENLQAELSTERIDSDDELLIKLVRRRKRIISNSTKQPIKAEETNSEDSGKPFTCEQCGKAFIKKQRYEGHLRLHQGLRPYACTQCPRSFDKAIRLRNHILIVHTETPPMHRCTYESCEKAYKTRDGLAQHVSIIHRNQIRRFSLIKNRKSTKPFACNKCSKTFFKKDRYEGHLRTHDGLKPYLCPYCDKQYSKKTRLTVHISAMHSDNPEAYPCLYEGCEKIYKTEEGRSQHEKIIHLKLIKREPSKRQFICEQCGKIFRTVSGLKEHEMMHRGEYPFKCQQCPSRYRTACKLREHMLKHEGIKKFECKICGMKKTTQREVKEHMNVHTREKTYPCTMCKSCFLTNANLVRHIKVVHNGDRSFKCPHCDEAFGKSETLKHHVMRHTGEKPHQCPICSRRFIQKAACRYHVQRHAKNSKNLLSSCPTEQNGEEVKMFLK